MSLKRWVLGKVHGPSGETRNLKGRRVPPSLNGTFATDAAREPTTGGVREPDDDARSSIAHLGPYTPLIAAIRSELEHFVESQLRLHLAIAERDRYVLTSIDIDCDEDDRHRALLRRFVAEFKPEQIKRYLARDIIAGLRNASAIDLSQFAGLNIARDPGASPADDPYCELIAELQKGDAKANPHDFDVTLVGRWVQTDAPVSDAAAGRGRSEARKPEGGHTPLAGRTLALEIEDAHGARRIELAAVVPGRRYVVGKDPSSDVVVEGVYASRRHCEVWFDRDAWWVVDAGSTNGIRVEAGTTTMHTDSRGATRVEPIEVPNGALIILSAATRGEPRLYPRLRLHFPVTATAVTSATTGEASLVTPLAPSRLRRAPLTIVARMASGVRELNLGERSLPLGVGRSREQALVIDRAHADVSGRHLEIVASEEAGAWVVVHGDNGVTVEGAAHGPGTKFLWKSGETMLLGRASTLNPACTLTLSRGV